MDKHIPLCDRFNREPRSRSSESGIAGGGGGSAVATTHRLPLSHGLAQGARACDVEEAVLLVGRQRGRGSADITASGQMQGRGGSGVALPS